MDICNESIMTTTIFNETFQSNDSQSEDAWYFWCTVGLVIYYTGVVLLALEYRKMKRHQRLRHTSSIMVGFCGLKGSGKDTGALLLEEFGFEKASFAKTLKDIVAIAFEWNRDMLEGTTQKSRIVRKKIDPYWSKTLNMPDLTPVRALQLWGTNLVRDHFHNDFWVKTLLHRFDLGKYGARIAVTDVRFPNEIQAIQDHGGLVIRIIRDPLPEWYMRISNGENPETIPDLPHESEWKSVGYEDLIIHNNGSIEDLKALLVQALVLYGYKL